MNRIIYQLLLPILLIAANSITFAQDDMMKIWEAYMTPGKMHEMLAKQSGDWAYESKIWMAPGMDPETYSGTATISMILGGRYQEMKTFGEMMGMQMEGRSITAYDNGKKEFISTWIDNFGTGLMITTGKYDEATNSTTMTGKMYDPMSGTDVNVKTVGKFINENKSTFEMYMMMGDQEFKTMELTYTRKK